MENAVNRNVSQCNDEIKCSGTTAKSCNNENVIESNASGCDENKVTKPIVEYSENQKDAQDGPLDAEDLDPRIQVELEKLNSSTDVINKLELDLEEARSTFRHLLGESGRHLNQLYKEHGSSVEKARCYYDARMKARVALSEAQRAAARFEKASSAHDAAKEMVTLAEEGFMERGVVNFDQAWQEMLNHATKRVNESEVERNLSAEEHKVKSRSYQIAEQKVIVLQRSLKRSINKSRPYFEAKARLNQSLDDQKRQIQLIEETIQMTKTGYSDSLKQLEKISEEIHERRRTESSKKMMPKESMLSENMKPAILGTRQDGVGAEFPSPCPSDKILKQTNSKKANESRKDKSIVKKTHRTASRKERNKYMYDQSTDGSSDNFEPGAKSLQNVNYDDVDSAYLIEQDDSNSMKNKDIKVKKLRKKKYEKLLSKCVPDNSPMASNKQKAIKSIMKIDIQSEKNKYSSSENESHQIISDKRKSVSSSSTTESAGNEGPSARISANSNNSDGLKLAVGESASSSSSSSSISTELDSPKSCPKLCKERLNPSIKHNATKSGEIIANKSSNSVSSTPCKDKFGLPIHPFENILSLNGGDTSNSKKDVTNIGGHYTCSPIKKSIYSPTGLTNKYLSIKQEESEFSDAESLASLDPLDDTQIDQLMKDAILQQAADDILHHTEKELASISESNT